MTNNIQAVIFDNGGTLTPGGLANESAIKLAKIFHLNVDKIGPVVDKLIEAFQSAAIDEDGFWAGLEKKLKIEVPLEIRGSFWEMEAYLDRTEIYDWAIRLHETGVKIAILSNVIQPLVDYLRQHKMYDGFDPLILSCEVGCAKPDPKIYQIAADRLGLKPEECIFVDDQERFLAPAKKLGMRTILATNMPEIRITFGELMGRRDWKTASSAK